MGLSSYSAAEIVMKRSLARTNAYDDGTGMWPLPEADLREHGFRFTIADVRPTRDVRPAAVAGLFYPAEPEALRARIAHCLNASGPYGSDGPGRPPKMVIVPHAGYEYSGAVAAHAYARLSGRRDQVKRVVLIGPAHRAALRAMALPGVDAFETPLGQVPLDQAATADLDGLTQVRRDDLPHAGEHSLEVQLPFLQEVLDEFTLVPIVAGEARPAEVAQVLVRLWGGDETCIVVSSDLSHYLPHVRAQRVDRATAQQILEFDARLDPQQACGATPINGALLAARVHGLVPRLLDLRDSGQITGDLRRVVGYGAFAFDSP
jgi:AmmeMemoRadiSam system protein B